MRWRCCCATGVGDRGGAAAGAAAVVPVLVADAGEPAAGLDARRGQGQPGELGGHRRPGGAAAQPGLGPGAVPCRLAAGPRAGLRLAVHPGVPGLPAVGLTAAEPEPGPTQTVRGPAPLLTWSGPPRYPRLLLRGERPHDAARRSHPITRQKAVPCARTARSPARSPGSGM